MNFNQLCSINYGTTQQKRFFKHLLELRSLLEDKYKLLFIPISFRFCLYKYHPPACLPPEILTNQCRTQNRPSSPLEDYCFSTLQWKVTARIQSRKNLCVCVCVCVWCVCVWVWVWVWVWVCGCVGVWVCGCVCGCVCVSVSIRNTCTTVNSSTGRRPVIVVNRSGATRQPVGKFPAGQTTGLCEYAYAFLCSVVIETCRPVDNQNV